MLSSLLQYCLFYIVQFSTLNKLCYFVQLPRTCVFYRLRRLRMHLRLPEIMIKCSSCGFPLEQYMFAVMTSTSVNLENTKEQFWLYLALYYIFQKGDNKCNFEYTNLNAENIYRISSLIDFSHEFFSVQHRWTRVCTNPLNFICHFFPV